MPFSGATKKLQQVVDMADDLYGKIAEVREQVASVRESVERTDDRVGRIERRLDLQTAIIEAIADDQGIDVDEVRTRAAIDEAEADTDGEPPGQSGDAE